MRVYINSSNLTNSVIISEVQTRQSEMCSNLEHILKSGTWMHSVKTISDRYLSSASTSRIFPLCKDLSMAARDIVAIDTNHHQRYHWLRPSTINLHVFFHAKTQREVVTANHCCSSYVTRASSPTSLSSPSLGATSTIAADSFSSARLLAIFVFFL